MKLLECQAISIRYAGKTALKALSFDVQQGECLALVGLNGAGKTSLLKALLDFSDIHSGQISLFGQPHTQPQARAQLAFLPEQFLPADYLHGSDFLHYMLRLYHGTSARISSATIAQMCDALGLDAQQLKHPLRTYSKGTRQKLGLLACFLSDKQLLILDEPMSGLDPKARALTRAQIKRHQAMGKTLLFSAHHLEDVGLLCDRMLVLHEGQRAFLGTPEAFLQTYAGENLEQAFLRCIESS